MTEQRPLNTAPLPVRLRVEDYLLLDEAGAFADYAKTELIDGEIVFMNAQHRPHAATKTRLYFATAEMLKRSSHEYEALVEASIEIPPHNAPEPDIVITSAPNGAGLVPLDSVILVVEIADTTLSHDIGRMATIYAQVSISEYWVADVNARVVYQMWSPHDGAYREKHVIDFGDPLVAATIVGLTVPTTGL